jgi:outer membrane immunogenic protein
MRKPLRTGFVFVILAMGIEARAADLPPIYKAPPPAPAPIYTWTGWYVGGNVGYGLGRASADVNYFAPGDGVPAPTVCPPAGFALCINGSDTVDMNGVIGGVQAGYNWQNGNYLLGVEADFQGSGQRGTRDFAVGFLSSSGPGTAAISITERMPWMGTVRGRVGYVANQWLLYATGGLAYGRIEGVDSSAGATGTGGPNPVWSFSGSGVTKIGWTVGGGAELALGGNWTAKFEYLFVDLGSFDTTFTGLAGCFGINFPGGGGSCSTVSAGTGTFHTHFTDNIVRVGLNYQFH